MNPPRINALLAALLILLPPACMSADNDVELRALTAALIHLAGKDDGGVSFPQQAMVVRIQKFGATAIPYLLPLLEHPKPAVRELAGYALHDTQGLTEVHLDALIAGRLRGNGWIPPVIARIGTPRAMRFLVDELKKEKRTGTQLTIALSQAGKKSVPCLVEIFEREPEMDEALSSAIRDVFSQMGEEAQPAVEPLVRVAADPKRPVQVREGAIQSLGAMGVTARSAVPTLQEIARKEDAALAGSAEYAIACTGSPEAVPIVLQWLKDSRGIRTFWQLSAMGTNAISAGPALLKLLNDDNWGFRVDAARTLGFIGYSGAGNALTRCLGNEDDWELVWASAQSLGRLRFRSALPALQQTARSHWYPPVREEAQKAIHDIEGGKTGTSRQPSEDSIDFSWDGWGNKMKRSNISRGYPTGPTLVREPDQLDRKTLAQVHYQVEGDETRKEGDRRFLSPNCGLKLDHGLLLGVDQGEWGGELVFQGEHSSTRRLLGVNIHAIHRLGSTIAAVADGMVYKVVTTTDGQWCAVPWKSLPGSPERSGCMKDGRLFIACRGGDVVMSADGRLGMYGAPARP